MKTTIPILFLILLTFSCEDPFGGNGYNYNTGSFPDTPTNLGDINSEYDDYNSTAPWLGGTSPLCFSSNRNSRGKDFDFVYKLLNVIMDKTDGTFDISENKNNNLDVFAANMNINQAMSKVNTSDEQLGPCLIPQGISINRTGSPSHFIEKYILMYATTESGNLDIRFTHNHDGENYTQPLDISFLNSDSDDAYPVPTADSTGIYFCSNRTGNFDIYKAELNPAATFIDAISDSTCAGIHIDNTLSSPSDDKCPFIYGKRMIFSSNRPGGYGGFDLYYSILENGQWSTPVNFGDKINTAHDEYRPILIEYYYDFTNEFMLFSSNRPGGHGGFDLYYVGVERL